jgi:mannonate dehydratase
MCAKSTDTLGGETILLTDEQATVVEEQRAMRITDAKVIVCCPGRNFVTLKITTEEGVFGLGDATLNGRELAVASYLTDHILPLLVGRDARRIEETWQYLYQGAYWRRGSVTMCAIAAVDTALWDIKAKSLNVPLYQLLGGASREGVLVYGHASGRDMEETVKAVANDLELGYKAIRAQSGIPGLASTYGVGVAGRHYEPAEKNAPPENQWSSEHYLNFVPQLFARLRQELGPDLHLLHDVHHRLTPIEAARLGRELEPYHLFWLEDPVPAELQEGFRIIREHTTTPLAVGEVFNSIYDCQQLIEQQWIDYIRTAVVHAGGISHLRRIANLAELYHVRTGCHGATDLSPVSMAAALHFDLSIHNFGIQEYMPHTAETDQVFPHSYTFQNGYMHPGEKPGLGVEIDESQASRHPYQRAYLPTNRKLDGTVHSW